MWARLEYRYLGAVPGEHVDLSVYFPVQAVEEGVSLSLLEARPEGAAGAWRLRLRLVTPDEAAEGGVDAKEQEVVVPPAEPARLRAHLTAWSASLPALLAEVDSTGMLPSDLFFFELLSDPSLQEAADFAAVMGDGSRWEALWEARAAAEFRAHLTTHLGAGDARAAAIEALARRPSVALHIDEDEPSDLPKGASRLGGHPDLPPDYAWPQIGGNPLTFLAQLDLADLHATLGEATMAALPKEGWLLFFFGLSGWGTVPSAKARGGGRVMHVVAPRRALVRRAPPAGAGVLALRSLVPEVEPRPLPNIETPFYALLMPPSPAAHSEEEEDEVEEVDPYSAAWEVFGFLAGEMQPSLSSGEERPRDRLLGYADPLQSDPYVQCAIEDGRIPAEEAWDRAVLAQGAAWDLLLQTDSDPEAGVLLGEGEGGGVVQFFLRPHDLAARRWDRVRTVWQRP